MEYKEKLLQLLHSGNKETIQLGLQLLDSIEELIPMQELLLPSPEEQALLDEQFFGRRWREPPMEKGRWLLFLTELEVKQRNVFFTCDGKRFFIQSDLDFALVFKYALNLRQLEIRNQRQPYILELLAEYQPPLRTLILEQVGLSGIAEGLKWFKGLEILALVNNNLQELPAALFELNQLKSLFLNHNQLSILPVEMGQLTQLQKLSLDDNQLTSLPETIGQLRELVHFSVDKNLLEVLPNALFSCRQLQYLSANSNSFHELPSTIAQLQQLQYLYLEHNDVSYLPEALETLTELKELNVRENPLSALPEGLWAMDDLKIQWRE